MSKGKGIFGGKDDEAPGDDAPPAATPAANAPAASTPASPTARTPNTPPTQPRTDKDGRELNVAGKPVDESAPPLGEQDVAAPAPAPAAANATSSDDRESWGDAPTHEALKDAHYVEVRTRDPRLKRAYAAGVEVGREPRTIALASLRAIGRSAGEERVASLLTDPAIDVRIVDGKGEASASNKGETRDSRDKV